MIISNPDNMCYGNEKPFRLLHWQGKANFLTRYFSVLTQRGIDPIWEDLDGADCGPIQIRPEQKELPLLVGRLVLNTDEPPYTGGLVIFYAINTEKQLLR